MHFAFITEKKGIQTKLMLVFKKGLSLGIALVGWVLTVHNLTLTASDIMCYYLQGGRENVLRENTSSIEHGHQIAATHAGHGVSMQDVHGSNPGETTMIFTPYFAGDRLLRNLY